MACREAATFYDSTHCMTDERLLKQARQGDEAAFERLYERHRDLVFRFAYRLSQSPEIAEEITHDCFVSLLQTPQRFAPDVERASLRTYLCAIARNLAFKRLRRAGRETALEEWAESLAAPATCMAYWESRRCFPARTNSARLKGAMKAGRQVTSLPPRLVFC